MMAWLTAESEDRVCRSGGPCHSSRAIRRNLDIASDDFHDLLQRMKDLVKALTDEVYGGKSGLRIKCVCRLQNAAQNPS